MTAAARGGGAKIRRGTATARKRPTVKARAVKASRKVESHALATIPMSSEKFRKLGNYLLGGALVAGVLAGVVAMKLPQMIGTEIGEGIGSLGFAVKRIEITGIDRMDREPVYNIAVSQQSRAMPLVDIGMIRDQLMHYGWVQDARVSRRLPDTLVVDIVERKPTAIWQHHQRLALIDGEGVVLAPVKLDDMPDLPLVIGPDANRQTGQLAELIASTPSLKPMMAGATWIGGRRWDLRFQSGETLALPEGTDAAKAALQKFAQLDTSARLLGQGFVRFDMRVPGKFVVRVSSEPGRRIDQDVADDAKSTTDT